MATYLERDQRFGSYSGCMVRKRIPVEVCALDEPRFDGRMRQWSELFESALETEQLFDGVRASFAADSRPAVDELIELEAVCCGESLQFVVEERSPTFDVRITSPDASLQELMHAATANTQ